MKSCCFNLDTIQSPSRAYWPKSLSGLFVYLCRKVQNLDFQSEFSMSQKSSKSFRLFFIKNKSLWAYFFKRFFGNFNSKNTFFLKSGLIFDEAAKHSRLLIFGEDGLKNRIAEGVASKLNDSRHASLKHRDVSWG